MPVSVKTKACVTTAHVRADGVGTNMGTAIRVLKTLVNVCNSRVDRSSNYLIRIGFSIILQLCWMDIQVLIELYLMLPDAGAYT